jgi:hypothetical protein
VIAEKMFTIMFLDLAEKFCCVRKVGFHEARRERSIALFNSVTNWFVEGESMLKLHKLRSDHHHIEHGTMNSMEETSREPIAGSLKNGSMKKKICRDELYAISLAGFKVANRLTK